MPGPLTVFCQCAHREYLSPETRRALAASLRAAAVDLWEVRDLCEATVSDAAGLARLRAAERVTVLACRPRAVRWLLHAGGVDMAPDRLTVVDLRTLSPEAALHACGLTRVDGEASLPAPEPKPESWVPWFPVIDRARCTNCRQCLSFCPFGVYALSAEKRVEVRNPRQCKDNCPACARVCPELAIVFPKCPDSPIDGAEVTEADLVRRRDFAEKAMRSGGDMRALLARRREQAARLRQRAAATADGTTSPDAERSPAR